MPLYRIDYRDDASPVKDKILVGSDFLSRHMTTARKRATEVATTEGRDVVISRIDNSGNVRPALVIRADGGAEKPQGMKGEDCKAGPGKPPCFCVNCRASRRA